VNFSKLKIVLKKPLLDDNGNMLREGIVISYGNLMDVTLNFFIIAFCIYLVVRVLRRHREKAEDPKNKEVPTPKDIELLSNIHEELKKMNAKR
jgi:large conductance mechanosensitive channel